MSGLSRSEREIARAKFGKAISAGGEHRLDIDPETASDAGRWGNLVIEAYDEIMELLRQASGSGTRFDDPGNVHVRFPTEVWERLRAACRPESVETV